MKFFNHLKSSSLFLLLSVRATKLDMVIEAERGGHCICFTAQRDSPTCDSQDNRAFLVEAINGNCPKGRLIFAATNTKLEVKKMLDLCKT